MMDAPADAAGTRLDDTCAGVAEACAMVAHHRGGGRKDVDDLFPAAARDLVLAGRAIPVAERSTALADCLAAVEFVARGQFRRHRVFNPERVSDGLGAWLPAPAWSSLLDAMQQCSVSCEAPMEGEAGWTEPRAAGRGIGQVVTWLMAGGRAPEAVAVARCALTGTMTMVFGEVFTGAIGVAGAGAAMTSGCMAAADRWGSAFGDRKVGPLAMAWLTAGGRLALDSKVRESMETCDSLTPWSLAATRESLVRSARAFDADETLQYRQACAEAGAAVRAFNAHQDVSELGWSVSEPASSTMLDFGASIEAALAMNQAARRLAGGVAARTRRRT